MLKYKGINLGIFIEKLDYIYNIYNNLLLYSII